jgi:hypothetical protein
MTYPSEAWPTDAEVEALDGGADEATGLPYVAKGTGPTSIPTYEVQYNRRLHRQNKILAHARGGAVVVEGALQIGVYPLSYTLAGARKVFGGATDVSVPDDATRKVYIDSSNALQLATDWPADIRTYVPLAEVTASSGVVEVSDVRQEAAYVVPEFTSAIGGYDLSMALADAIADVEISVGVEYLDTIYVSVQARDAAGNNLSERVCFRAWLSDSVGGGETCTAPSSALWTTGTTLELKTADVSWRAVMTDATGKAELQVGDSGDFTWYLHVAFGGKVFVSSAITFAM